jgi:ABC-2 type transport system ATP-binding protein
MTPILQVQSLEKHYPETTAVDGISFAVKSGQCFGMLGPNGAGKTTTIEMMEGITRPSAGQILYKGQPPGKAFRNECGIQFQHTALQEFLTVIETLKLFQGLYANSADLNELIEQCRLSEFLNQDTRNLSGGQRQRMLLAIALINKPEIVFLDEPTTGLDPQARRNFWALIQSIQNSGTTIILSTHYMEEADVLCDEIIIMDHGSIIAQGVPADLLHQHFTERVIQLPEASLNEQQIGRIREERLNLMANNGIIEISTRDVNHAMHTLLRAGIALDRLQVRQRNLEDLFLELTGKELRL